jgi:hypothetical protein
MEWRFWLVIGMMNERLRALDEARELDFKNPGELGFEITECVRFWQAHFGGEKRVKRGMRSRSLTTYAFPIGALTRALLQGKR